MAAQNEDPKNAKQAQGGDAPESRGEGKGPSEDAITQLKNDHRRVEQLFDAFGKASRRAEKEKLAKQICQELIIHTMLEEEIFYPACREHIEDEPLDEAQVEHDGAKVLINELLQASAAQPFYDAKVKVLSEMIKHHVNEEEKRSEGIFAKAKASGVDTDQIAQRLAARKAELLAQAERDGPERPRPRSFSKITEMSMPQGQKRDRDERGRFTSDDEDDRRSASRPGRSRSSRNDDDDDYRGRGQGRMPERDQYGRFMSDDDDRGGGFRARLHSPITILVNPAVDICAASRQWTHAHDSAQPPLLRRSNDGLD